jgi:hypothetical protein
MSIICHPYIGFHSRSKERSNFHVIVDGLVIDDGIYKNSRNVFAENGTNTYPFPQISTRIPGIELESLGAIEDRE